MTITDRMVEDLEGEIGARRIRTASFDGRAYGVDDLNVGGICPAD